MRINITNEEIITIANIGLIFDSESKLELSEESAKVVKFISDPIFRAMICKSANAIHGIQAHDDNGQGFDFTFIFNHEKGGVIELITIFIDDIVKTFLPDYKAGKILTKYGKEKIKSFIANWDERFNNLVLKLRKSNAEIFSPEECKLMDVYLDYRCKEVLNNPKLAFLPEVTSPNFGEAYSKFVSHEKELMRSVALGAMRDENDCLVTLDEWCRKDLLISEGLFK